MIFNRCRFCSRFRRGTGWAALPPPGAFTHGKRRLQLPEGGEEKD
jgi:hypothetical protein